MCPGSAFDTTISAARRSPAVVTTPSAFPPVTVISSTSTLRRTVPPWSSITRTIASAIACHAAHRVMHPEFPFEVRDQDIHRGHMRRVAPDEKRVERQRHAQARVTRTAGGGMAIADRSARQLPRSQAARGSDSIACFIRAGAQPLEPELVSAPAVLRGTSFSPARRAG